MTRGRVEAPLVTVVVPAFNAAATIEPTIRSILAQTLSDLEVIVVDDGSHDDTVGVVRRIEAQCPVKLVQRENGGPSAARNSGLEVARGRFVSVLDSDDLWLPR